MFEKHKKNRPPINGDRRNTSSLPGSLEKVSEKVFEANEECVGVLGVNVHLALVHLDPHTHVKNLSGA